MKKFVIFAYLAVLAGISLCLVSVRRRSTIEISITDTNEKEYIHINIDIGVYISASSPVCSIRYQDSD